MSLFVCAIAAFVALVAAAIVLILLGEDTD